MPQDRHAVRDLIGTSHTTIHGPRGGPAVGMKYLRERARLLERLREFFTSRGFTEVSTPRVDAEIIPELHIEPLEVPGLGYLQASPEMHMKRLLCAGSGPIFEIAKCFRRDEHGQFHHPEFTMVEWYRPGDDMQAGIDLLDEFVGTMLSADGERAESYSPADELRLVGPTRRSSSAVLTYREAFGRALNIDPHVATTEVLQADAGQSIDDRDELLNLLLAQRVEPTLGTNGPEIVYHYPATQSALATTVKDSQGVEVAERFELYYKGIELANGYHELTDAKVLRQRLVQVNEQRVESGRTALPLPEKLLAAMQDLGLSPCAGVALGFDRLLMLVVGADSIDEITEE